ncbi:MAG: class I SAM-dependent methyltransferase [Proteobacteria bacterium]|nr:class I SAM-dependent methyltransferase [Pseudomonadota bacterium]
MITRVLEKQLIEVGKVQGTLERIYDAVASKGDLSFPQALLLYALVRELQPDLIIELGRGMGNSTAVFAQALDDAQNGKLVSFCLYENWQQTTEPRLRKFLPEEWFERIQLFTEDLTQFDFGPLADSAETVVVFWDAHGFDIAEHVLGHLLPLIASKRHVVLCHDIADRHFVSPESRLYGDKRLWRGMEACYENPDDFNDLWTDWAVTKVDQALPIFDFCRRNGIELHSVDREFRRDLASAEALLERLSLSVQSTFVLAYFDLSEATDELTFPPDLLRRHAG